jgi:hypothetical protein
MAFVERSCGKPAATEMSLILSARMVRLGRFGSVLILAVAATGCCVLPFGEGRGGRGHDRRFDDGPSQRHAAPSPAPYSTPSRPAR